MWFAGLVPHLGWQLMVADLVCMLFFTIVQISDISLLDVLGVFGVIAVRFVLADDI